MLNLTFLSLTFKSGITLLFDRQTPINAWNRKEDIMCPRIFRIKQCTTNCDGILHEVKSVWIIASDNFYKEVSAFVDIVAIRVGRATFWKDNYLS